MDPISTTAAAVERNRVLAAERAIDDPLKLARAARIVRLALERQRLTLADIVSAKPSSRPSRSKAGRAA